MKRSEILLYIKDTLKHELWGYFAKHSEHDDALVDAGVDVDDLAEKVLAEVVKAGMRPTRQVDPGDPQSRRVVEEFEDEKK